MARTTKKFSAGGAQGRYERRMADIEKDYKKAIARKTGKDAEVAEAKRQQRIADAKDDLAKRTGADRSATRAAERAAESNLTKTRKYGAAKAVTTEAPAGKVTDTLGAITAPKSDLATADKKPAQKLVQKPVQKPTQKSNIDNPSMSSTRAGLEAGRADFRKQQQNRRKINAAAEKEPFTKLDKAAFDKLKTGKDSYGAASIGKPRVSGAPATGGTALRGRPMTGGLFRTSDEFRKSQEAKYGKAKGGSVKKEKTMKYRSGGSTPPQPSAADRAADAKFRKSVKDLKVTPENAAAIGRGNRSEASAAKPKKYAAGGVTKEMPSAKAMGSLGMAKGGKAKAKGKPFAATKFGAALVKKSADTKGRAMVKKYASGGLVAGHKSADGCAVRGKTKGKMLASGGSCSMKKGRK